MPPLMRCSLYPTHGIPPGLLCTEHPPLYWWYSIPRLHTQLVVSLHCTVLNIHHCTTVLNIHHCTDDILLLHTQLMVSYYLTDCPLNHCTHGSLHRTPGIPTTLLCWWYPTTVLMVSLHCTDGIPPRNSWCPSTVMNIHHCTLKISPHCSPGIPPLRWKSTTVLMVSLHCTDDILLLHTQFMVSFHSIFRTRIYLLHKQSS